MQDNPAEYQYQCSRIHYFVAAKIYMCACDQYHRVVLAASFRRFGGPAGCRSYSSTVSQLLDDNFRLTVQLHSNYWYGKRLITETGYAATSSNNCLRNWILAGSNEWKQVDHQSLIMPSSVATYTYIPTSPRWRSTLTTMHGLLQKCFRIIDCSIRVYRNQHNCRQVHISSALAWVYL